MHRDSPISAIAPFSFKVDCELLSFIVKVQKRAGPSIDIVVVRRVDGSNLATLSEHGFMSLKTLSIRMSCCTAADWRRSAVDWSDANSYIAADRMISEIISLIRNSSRMAADHVSALDVVQTSHVAVLASNNIRGH